MKGGDAFVVEPFISLFVTFNQLCFLWEMSLSYVEDRLSSVSPLGQCLLVGLMQGQMKTTVEKNKQWKRKHKLVTWSHAHSYNTCTYTGVLLATGKNKTLIRLFVLT